MTREIAWARGGRHGDDRSLIHSLTHSLFTRIGNQDVIDLLSSVMARNPGRTTLPWISTGDMMCERGETRAAVEWKVSSSQAAAV